MDSIGSPLQARAQGYTERASAALLDLSFLLPKTHPLCDIFRRQPRGAQWERRHEYRASEVSGDNERSVLRFWNGFLLPLLSLSSLLSLSTSHLLPTTTSQMSYRVIVLGTRNQVHLAVLAEQALKNFNEVQQQPPFTVRAGSLPLAIYFGEHSQRFDECSACRTSLLTGGVALNRYFDIWSKDIKDRDQLESLEEQLRLQVPIDQQVSCNPVRASVGPIQSDSFLFLFSSDVRSQVARGHGGSTAHSNRTTDSGRKI